MSNMSYCRFENTLRDLQDCMSAINGGDLNGMSRHEINAFVDLILICKDIADQFEDYTETRIEDFINEQQKDYEY